MSFGLPYGHCSQSSPIFENLKAVDIASIDAHADRCERHRWRRASGGAKATLLLTDARQSLAKAAFPAAGRQDDNYKRGHAMRSFDFAPYYRSTVGFDRLFSMLDQVGGVELESRRREQPSHGHVFRGSRRLRGDGAGRADLDQERHRSDAHLPPLLPRGHLRLVLHEHRRHQHARLHRRRTRSRAWSRFIRYHICL